MTKPPSTPPRRKLPPQAGCCVDRTDTQPSEHTDFSESTDEIAPLTEEEKKAKLEELRQRLKEKRAVQSTVDKEEAKRNEVCRTPYSQLFPIRLLTPSL